MGFTPSVTEQSHTLDIGDDGWTADIAYDVVARSQIEAISVLRQDQGVFKGSTYTSAYGEKPNPPMICRNLRLPKPKRPAPVGGTGLYRIDANFSQTSGSGSGSSVPEPVPGGPPVYLWDANLYASRATVDRNGQAIKNYAGQTMSVAVQVAAAHLEVLWYVTRYEESTLVRVAGSVNANAWHGFDAGQAQCVGIKPEPAGPDLFLMRGRFDGRKIGWQPKPFNEGLQEKLFTVPVLNIPVYGANQKVGDSLSTPRPLKSDGRFKPENEEGDVLEVDFYEPINYKSLLGI